MMGQTQQEVDFFDWLHDHRIWDDLLLLCCSSNILQLVVVFHSI